MNRRELIRGAAVVAAASTLPVAAVADEWVWETAYSQRWWEVHDYLIDLMKRYYGVDEQHEGWPEVEKLAHGLVDYNFGRLEIE